jgi:hypothetical protein
MSQVHEEVLRLRVAHLGPARGVESAANLAGLEESWGLNDFVCCGARPFFAPLFHGLFEPLKVNRPPGW